MTQEKDLEKIEIDLLLEGIRRQYGYDFTNYSRQSLKRRLDHVLAQWHFGNFTALLSRVLHDEEFFSQFLIQMSISVTEMFRDPTFYKFIREKIVPVLKTFPFVKIWHAGCATGEEVYSMAILLHEEDFLKRVRIYATDFNKHSLDKGQKGVYPSRLMGEYNDNYLAAGGISRLSDYYSTGYELVKFKDHLKEQITFSYHNLVTDGVFGEMNMILCRNVLIYFDKHLKDRVLSLFIESLHHGGFLCLGAKESLNFTGIKKVCQPFDLKERIYKKCAVPHERTASEKYSRE